MITELTARIEEWAKARNLHTADPAKQMLKLGEEFGELCQGMAQRKGVIACITSIGQGNMYG